MANRDVTERDFRMAEYRDADPKDYEFDGDGRPARKDRWETAVRLIAFRVGLARRRSFEIAEVVAAVDALVDDRDRWQKPDFDDRETWPADGASVEARLDDGSILRDVTFHADDRTWRWRGSELALPVSAFRDQRDHA